MDCVKPHGRSNDNHPGEPRVEYHEGRDMVPGATFSTTMPDDLVLAMNLDLNRAVVAVTHDPMPDDAQYRNDQGSCTETCASTPAGGHADLT